MLDRVSPIPLYHQVSQHLQEQIKSGTLVPGNALPTEEELQRIYGVSRATVRQAVQQLASAGLVRLARPHGTFVTQPRLVEPLPALISFSDEVRRAGLTPSTRVLRVSRDPAPPEVRRHLDLAADATALCVTRLRLASDQPIALHTSWLTPSLGLDVDDDFSESLYGVLRAHGAEPARAEQVLDAANATPDEAAALETPRRAALLVVSRVTYDGTDRPIEYVVGRYRADRYRYSMSLNATATPTPLASGMVRV